MEAQKLSKKKVAPKMEAQKLSKKRCPQNGSPNTLQCYQNGSTKTSEEKWLPKFLFIDSGSKLVHKLIRDICFQNQAAWGIHKSKFCIPALSRTSPRLAARRGWQVSDLHWSSTCFVCLTPFPMGNSDQWAKHVNFNSSVSFFLTITQASPFPRECSELDAEEHEDASGDPLHREGLAAL